MHNKLTSVFSGANVLVTGHTGFKGSWLTFWLKQLGAKVTGIALDPPTTPSHFDIARIGSGIEDLRLDIREGERLASLVKSAQPDFVFHLAAQPLVQQSYEDPITTWNTNVMGTVHLLNALRSISKSCIGIIITSDKCYENVEWVWGYRETDRLGGKDPYSSSKAAAEMAIHSYVKSYFPNNGPIRIASARAGNVIGGGDWAQDRIVPDCARAWSKDLPIQIRNPSATRPWQHVLEPLSGYLNLAMVLATSGLLHGESFNFGPPPQQNRSVLDLVQEMSRYWKKVRWDDVSSGASKNYESNLLKLDCDKAAHFLGWQPAMNFSDTILMTAEWYRSFYEDSSTIANVTHAQLNRYTEMAAMKEIPWAN